MKITKILTDLLKAVEKKKTFEINYGYDDGYVYYLPDKYRAYRIHSDEFLVDMVKALPDKTPLMARKFFDDSNAEDAIKTNELREINKVTVVKIVGANSYAWINTAYLKEFEADCTFKITGPKAPVYIYEQDKLVGLILPVFIKED